MNSIRRPTGNIRALLGGTYMTIKIERPEGTSLAFLEEQVDALVTELHNRSFTDIQIETRATTKEWIKT